MENFLLNKGSWLALGFLFLVVVFSLAVVLVGRTNAPQSANALAGSDAKLTSVDATSFAQSLSNQKIIIDVRTPAEFQEGHISNAVNLDFYDANFKQRLSEMDRTSSYAIYCRSGNRSEQTLALMRSLGFADVTDLQGGVIAWERGGGKLCIGVSC